MTVVIRYFASLRETIGLPSETLESDCDTVGSLKQVLMARGGAYAECLGGGRPVRVAVNHVMADDATVLKGHVEVAFFPPVTGG